MSAAVESVGRGVLPIRITGAASAAAGGQGEIANPEGVDVLITRTTLVVFDNSTGATDLSCGIAASGGTFTDIISALAMGSAGGSIYNGHARQATAKTAITGPALWTAALVLGITASATAVGLDALLLVEYIRIDERADEG